MIKQINQGRYTANISKNSGGFLVIIDREGSCLYGMPARLYVDMKRAEAGARRMLAKVA